MKTNSSAKIRDVFQVSIGITQWPINLSTSPMMIHKITPSVELNLVS